MIKRVLFGVVVFCIIFAAILYLPFVIEQLLSTPNFITKLFTTRFSQSEWFGFLGSYTGAIVTVFALLLTIGISTHQNRKSIERQQKLFILELDKRDSEIEYSNMVEAVRKIQTLFSACKFDQSMGTISTEKLILQLSTQWEQHVNELAECMDQLFRNDDKEQPLWAILIDFRTFLEKEIAFLDFNIHEYFQEKARYKEEKERILRENGFDVRNGITISLNGRSADDVDMSEIADLRPRIIEVFADEFIKKLRVYEVTYSSKLRKACDEYCIYLDSKRRASLENKYPKQ